ncbi:hypothetical protein GALMADRAFT_138246 [Galerina marginata CBS 339.88]|uniref:Glycosyltransferase family 61 protein n=1 Tax=Galerina marginata (strain CBS 339.88) TaxID=685588 RepID=A0A067T6Y1_GALM3|nr:hypothetical protein GALMADRAFT_138246 [Galerina marginata CBS 339.88]
MFFRHGSLSRRDAFLLLIGAGSMHIWSMLFGQHTQMNDQSITINTHLEPQVPKVTVFRRLTESRTKTQTQTQTQTVTSVVTQTPKPQAILPFEELPHTDVLAHAPGWTLFQNLYMSNGTLFIIADEDERKKFPEIRMITSTGLEAINSPENIALREPTDDSMRIISPEEARKRWSLTTSGGREQVLNRVWTVEGNTLLFNDPKQFLRHYYHLVAELFFGVQAFWHGAFSSPVQPSDAMSPSSSHFSTSHPSAPPMHRAIFAHSNADGWRDDPGFNSYFLRATLPSLIVEHQEDWDDRIKATLPRDGQPERAWHFPTVLFTDRSAAHRGVMCGSTTQRTASEAWDYMRLKGKLRGLHVGGWWAPLREAMWRFAGAKEGLNKVTESLSAGTTPAHGSDEERQQRQTHFMSDNPVIVGLDDKGPTMRRSKIVDVGNEYQKKLPMPDKVVISYISRQSARNRKLIPEDHDGMVQALWELVRRKNKERKAYLAARDVYDGDEGGKREAVEDVKVPLEWEFNELIAERMSKDEQVREAARTTIMLGVHGNGLTHLVFMDPKRVSTVIEIFYPGGFAHDYYWTSRALGMRHYAADVFFQFKFSFASSALGLDSHHTYPNKPNVDYPDGFQGNEIPVYGPGIAQLIEERIAGKI